MKLLLVFLGAIIAVNGKAVSDHLSEADIKMIGEKLLKQVKSIKEEVEKIHDDASHAISSKLKQMPEIKKVEEVYIKGLVKKTMSVECAVSADVQYLEALENITTDILKKTLKNITNDEDNLNTIQKEMDSLQTSLEQNFDQEVQKCVKGSKTCRITRESIKRTDKLFRFIDLAKYKILSLAENEVSSEDVQGKVKTYLANIPNCLTGGT